MHLHDGWWHLNCKNDTHKPEPNLWETSRSRYVSINLVEKHASTTPPIYRSRQMRLLDWNDGLRIDLLYNLAWTPLNDSHGKCSESISHLELPIQNDRGHRDCCEKRHLNAPHATGLQRIWIAFQCNKNRNSIISYFLLYWDVLRAVSPYYSPVREVNVSIALKLTQEPVTVNGSPAVSRPERSSKRTARRYQYRSSGKLCALTKGTAGSVSIENMITMEYLLLSTCQTCAIFAVGFGFAPKQTHLGERDEDMVCLQYVSVK